MCVCVCMNRTIAPLCSYVSIRFVASADVRGARSMHRLSRSTTLPSQPRIHYVGTFAYCWTMRSMPVVPVVFLRWFIFVRPSEVSTTSLASGCDVHSSFIANESVPVWSSSSGSALHSLHAKIRMATMHETITTAAPPVAKVKHFCSLLSFFDFSFTYRSFVALRDVCCLFLQVAVPEAYSRIPKMGM